MARHDGSRQRLLHVLIALAAVIAAGCRHADDGGGANPQADRGRYTKAASERCLAELAERRPRGDASSLVLDLERGRSVSITWTTSAAEARDQAASAEAEGLGLGRSKGNVVMLWQSGPAARAERPTEEELKAVEDCLQ